MTTQQKRDYCAEKIMGWKLATDLIPSENIWVLSDEQWKWHQPDWQPDTDLNQLMQVVGKVGYDKVGNELAVEFWPMGDTFGDLLRTLNADPEAILDACIKAHQEGE